MDDYVLIPAVEYRSPIRAALFNDMYDNIKILIEYTSGIDKEYLIDLKKIISPFDCSIWPGDVLSSRLAHILESGGSSWINETIDKLDMMYRAM